MGSFENQVRTHTKKAPTHLDMISIFMSHVALHVERKNKQGGSE